MPDLIKTIKVSKKIQKRLIYLLYLLIVTTFIYFYPNKFLQNSNNANINPRENNTQYIDSENGIYFIGRVLVTRIVDGDTIHIQDANGKEDIVRFLAVNTPEVRNTNAVEICHGKNSTLFTKENLENKNIFIWGDRTQPKRDKYNRLLAYVSLEPNANTNSPFFNDQLISTGNAKVYRAEPPADNYYKYLELQKSAQQQKLGMWNNEVCK